MNTVWKVHIIIKGGLPALMSRHQYQPNPGGTGTAAEPLVTR